MPPPASSTSALVLSKVAVVPHRRVARIYWCCTAYHTVRSCSVESLGGGGDSCFSFLFTESVAAQKKAGCPPLAITCPRESVEKHGAVVAENRFVREK